MEEQRSRTQEPTEPVESMEFCPEMEGEAELLGEMLVLSGERR